MAETHKKSQQTELCEGYAYRKWWFEKYLLSTRRNLRKVSYFFRDD